MTPRGKGHWSAERIVEAMVSWAAEHGAPPTRRDWNYSGDGHPGEGDESRDCDQDEPAARHLALLP